MILGDSGRVKMKRNTLCQLADMPTGRQPSALPAMGHWEWTRPPRLPTIYLPTATEAAVVQSRLHEPCSVYYLASFYVRQKLACSL